MFEGNEERLENVILTINHAKYSELQAPAGKTFILRNSSGHFLLGWRSGRPTVSTFPAMAVRFADLRLACVYAKFWEQTGPLGTTPIFINQIDAPHTSKIRVAGRTVTIGNQVGMIFLLELITVCAVMLILAAVALPNLLQMRISENQAAARKQVLRVLDAISSVNICAITTGCNPAPVQPLIPGPGTITQAGYSYTFQQAGTTWSYVAVPAVPGFSGNQSFFASEDGVLRCGTTQTAPPC